MSTLLAELTANRLVLWRLRSLTDQLWCSVRVRRGELDLMVLNVAEDEAVIDETQPGIVALMERADDVRDQLVTDGWQEIDVDLDEPD